jgi:nitrile hydratase
MGGMQGLGRIEAEQNEPVFHAPWEGRVLAMNLATSAWRKWSLDAFRHQIEQIAPSDYLRMSYYEKWFTALTERLVLSGLATRTEVESGKPALGSVKATPPLTADQVSNMLRSGALASRDVAIDPRFRAGQRVRTRNMHPTGHTRLPRYARDKHGTVDRDHGVYVFPDTAAHSLQAQRVRRAPPIELEPDPRRTPFCASSLDERAQHVYSVRFAARELWGEQASPRDAVYIDLWDDYLEPA